MPVTQQEVLAQNLSPTVAEAARALARAVANSEVFRRFEAAQEQFTRDKKLQQQLRDYEVQQQQARLVRMWTGGEDGKTSEQQWNSLLENPVLKNYLTCEEELRGLLRDAAGRITSEVGIDYGAACAPAGGCC
jgi:cell fate (sporulation/competence/biofilm development) regulator YlbF (YheA/YmcA/DUF963 family)